jgi:hypothetical protein
VNARSAGAAKPNIVLMLKNNAGYGEIGVLNDLEESLKKYPPIAMGTPRSVSSS